MELSLAIKQIVRGEVKWDLLQRLGLQISFVEGVWTTDMAEIDSIPINIEDLAAGFLNMEGNNYAREWAYSLLAIDVIDFEPLENHPQGDALLAGLWDLSFGDPLSDKTVAAIREVIRIKG